MEYLDKIILLISCIFEIYIFYDFFQAYFEYRNGVQALWKRIAIGIAAVTCLFTVNTYGNSYINLLGAMVIIWTYLELIFNVNLGTRILYFIIGFFVEAGCEFLFGILLSIPSYMHKQNSVTNLSDIPWHFFTMKFLTYIIFALIKQFFGCSKKVVNDKIFVYYLCIPFASLAIMLLTYYSGIGASVNLLDKALLSASFALLLFGNIFVFQAFNRYSEKLYTIAEQKLIISRQAVDIQYYGQLQKLDHKYQDYIHNISHHLKTIGELAKENEINSIISILQDLNIELENAVFTIYCDNPVMNSILSEKKSAAEKNGICLDIYVEPGANLAKISDADVITMLSNLLDNALRAAESAENKSIIVRIYTENEGCFHIIKIKNYFAGNILSTEDGFLSTKKEEGIHGIGIKSVEGTAEKYDGYLECFVEEQLFTAVLVLPNT